MSSRRGALGWLAVVFFSALLAGPGWFHASTPAAPRQDTLDALRQRIKSGETAQVEAEARLILGEIERSEGADSMAAARIINVLVEAMSEGGKARDPETRALAERALAITEKQLGPDHVEIAEALTNLGWVFYRGGDLASARGPFERSLAMRERLLGPEDAGVGHALSHLGVVLMGQGDYVGARAVMERSVAVIEKAEGPESPRTGVAMTTLAVLLQQLGEFERVIALNRRGLPILEKAYGPASLVVSRVLTVQAINYRRLGDFGEARKLYERSLAILEAALPADHPDIAIVLHNLGLLASRMGDTERAVALARRALAIYGRTGQPESAPALAVAEALGTYLRALGEDAEAEEILGRTLAAREKTLGPDHPDTAESLSGLAMLHVSRGQASEALPPLERALAIYEKALGSTHHRVAICLSDLAQAESVLGRHDDARRHLTRALAIREALFGPDHPDVARSLTDLAELDLAHGTPASALSSARRAAAILLGHARETMAGLPERQALLLVSGQPRPEEVLLTGLLENAASSSAWLEAVWEWTLGRRGVVLEELAARHRGGLAADTPAAIEARGRLTEARRRLAALWVTGAGDDDPGKYQARLVEARQEREQAEAQLAEMSAAYRSERQSLDVSLSEVLAALPEKAVLVEWVRLRAGIGPPAGRSWRDVALVVRRDGGPSFVDIGPSEAVDAAVKAWRAALVAAWTEAGPSREGLTQLRERGERLRRLVWDPLAGPLRGAGRVLFVPDGPLHGVDLAALPDSAARYLIETGPVVQILTSGRDVVRLNARDPRAAREATGLLALGNPDFNADRVAQAAVASAPTTSVAFRGSTPACLSLKAATWLPLPESGREVAEVTAVARRRWPVETLTGSAASEDRLKQAAPRRRVLHLATHGFFLAPECVQGVADNPLLLSGLVLAGANHAAQADETSEDGILTAEEIAALDLSGVDLAVLSGCDTGRGTVAVGEGVFGLRRALEIAGVGSVVMSLWPVPDRAARAWMDRFYRERLAGAGIPDAARSASLSRLTELRRREQPEHPYLWAGFIPAGDWH